MRASVCGNTAKTKRNMAECKLEKFHRLRFATVADRFHDARIAAEKARDPSRCLVHEDDRHAALVSHLDFDAAPPNFRKRERR